MEPDNAEKGLPELVKKFGAYGIKITSVASSTDEKVFADAAAGIPVIRIMVSIDPEAGYMASEAKAKSIWKALYLCVRNTESRWEYSTTMDGCTKRHGAVASD